MLKSAVLPQSEGERVQQVGGTQLVHLAGQRLRGGLAGAPLRAHEHVPPVLAGVVARLTVQPAVAEQIGVVLPAQDRLRVVAQQVPLPARGQAEALPARQGRRVLLRRGARRRPGRRRPSQRRRAHPQGRRPPAPGPSGRQLVPWHILFLERVLTTTLVTPSSRAAGTCH